MSQHNLVISPPDVYVAKVSKTGDALGVFSSVSLEAGDLVEICPVILYTGSPKFRDRTSHLLAFYEFENRLQKEGKSEHTTIFCLGYGGLYNHSDTPNASLAKEIRQKKDLGIYDIDTTRAVAFVALLDIKAGDEITIDYGEAYWRGRNDKWPS